MTHVNRNAAQAINGKSMQTETELSELEKFSELIEASGATRPCQYPSCSNTIPENSEFRLCEKCRAFAARNAVALILDPCSPIEIQRKAEITHTLLTQMTAEEILRFISRTESLYLEMQKAAKLHNLIPEKKKVFKDLGEQIDEMRANNEAHSIRVKQGKKSEKKKQSRIEKLREMFPNMNDTQIKKLMGEAESGDEFADL